jgi:DNA-binding transcriptional regulator YdaS (Cro superfamily)
MDLQAYAAHLTPDQRLKFASEIRTSRGQLNNLICGHRRVTHKVAARIERATNRVVTRPELCPEDWWEVWEEIVGPDGKPTVLPQPLAEARNAP